MEKDNEFQIFYKQRNQKQQKCFPNDPLSDVEIEIFEQCFAMQLNMLEQQMKFVNQIFDPKFGIKKIILEDRQDFDCKTFKDVLSLFYGFTIDIKLQDIAKYIIIAQFLQFDWLQSEIIKKSQISISICNEIKLIEYYLLSQEINNGELENCTLQRLCQITYKSKESIKKLPLGVIKFNNIKTFLKSLNKKMQKSIKQADELHEYDNNMRMFIQVFIEQQKEPLSEFNKNEILCYYEQQLQKNQMNLSLNSISNDNQIQSQQNNSQIQNQQQSTVNMLPQQILQQPVKQSSCNDNNNNNNNNISPIQQKQQQQQQQQQQQINFSSLRDNQQKKKIKGEKKKKKQELLQQQQQQPQLQFQQNLKQQQQQDQQQQQLYQQSDNYMNDQQINQQYQMNLQSQQYVQNNNNQFTYPKIREGNRKEIEQQRENQKFIQPDDIQNQFNYSSESDQNQEQQQKYNNNNQKKKIEAKGQTQQDSAPINANQVIQDKKPQNVSSAQQQQSYPRIGNRDEKQYNQQEFQQSNQQNQQLNKREVNQNQKRLDRTQRNQINQMNQQLQQSEPIKITIDEIFQKLNMVDQKKKDEFYQFIRQKSQVNDFNLKVLYNGQEQDFSLSKLKFCLQQHKKIIFMFMNNYDKIFGGYIDNNIGNPQQQMCDQQALLFSLNPITCYNIKKPNLAFQFNENYINFGLHDLLIPDNGNVNICSSDVPNAYSSNLADKDTNQIQEFTFEKDFYLTQFYIFGLVQRLQENDEQ